MDKRAYGVFFGSKKVPNMFPKKEPISLIYLGNVN